MVDVARLKQSKDTLVSALVGLTKAAQEAIPAVIDFVEVLDDSASTENALAARASVEAVVAATTQAANKASKIAAKREIEPAAETAPKQKKKRAVDPNLPKRPPSAFLLWAAPERRAIQAERESAGQAHLGRNEISEQLSQRWKNLDPAKRKELEEKHVPAMDAWREALKEYKARESTSENKSVEEDAPTPEPEPVVEVVKKRRGKSDEEKKKRKKDT